MVYTIYQVYTWYIHILCINVVYTSIYEDIPYSIFHEYSWYITGISETVRYIPGIYQVYTWYISVVCRPHQYTRYIPTSQLMGLFRTFFIIIFL